jgi:hypothetical protein
MLADVRKTLRAKEGVDFVCVADVSGSMSCNNSVPMDTCVSLSMAISNGVEASSPYFNKILTFDSICEVVDLTSLEDKSIDRLDRVEAAMLEIKNAGWGGSTCLESVFERIAELEEKRVHVVGAAVSEVVLLILTDMQFDSGHTSDDLLKSEVLQAIYDRLGLKQTIKIVYWDICGNGAMSYAASENTSGTVLVSGYSESMVKCVCEGDFSDVSPRSFMISALSQLPYTIIDAMIRD